jgi:replicative DNA helicase
VYPEAWWLMSKIETNLKNVASERAVLAGLFQYGKESLIEIELLVSEDSFTLDVNKVLYKCILHALKDKDSAGYTDILSSAKSLELQDYVEKNEVLKHMSGIMNTPVHIDNVSEHAKKLKRLEFARKIQSQLRTIYTDLNKVTGDESITEILSLTENPIQDICLSYIKEDELLPQAIGNDIDSYICHLEQNQGKSIGITTGFHAFDLAIGGGLRRKCVDLIAARPKTGKSCLADNMALYVARTHKIPVLMLDTEMS